ncbi:hypothetical protein ACFE04_029566 [Oxalis oulophora]
MGGNGKKTCPRANHDKDHENQKRKFNHKDEKGNDGELVVYRILCPDRVIGSVIGKSGKVINTIRKETRAKIKVVDPFPAAKDRVITIYCYVKQKDNINNDGGNIINKEPLCAAQDALLKVHGAISNSIMSSVDSDKRQKGNVEECQILVPASQCANIIGKAGSVIKRLRSKTRASIKVTGKDPNDPSHSCAMNFDNFVLITGDSEAVKQALFRVSAIMYEFTPREEILLDSSFTEAPPIIISPSDLSLYQSGGLYSNSYPLIPSRSVSLVLGPAHVPEFQGYADSGTAWQIYISARPMVPAFVNASKPEELIVKVLCPFSKIGRVIGKGGATIKNIRQASGAHIEVDDTHADRVDCVITVTAAEARDNLKSMAVEAVLLLQAKMNDEEIDTVDMRLLVPSRVIGCVIGKSGSIITEIRKRTNADIRISKWKNFKVAVADTDYDLTEVSGEVGSVREALIQIVLRLRDYAFQDKDVSFHQSARPDLIYSSGTGLPMPSHLASVSPPVTPFGGRGASSNLYGYGSLRMADSVYGSNSISPSKLYGFSPTSAVDVLIPYNAISKVLGRSGSNIANIRKISEANVEISKSKSSRGGLVASISGTPEQKRSAESLIQAFILST